MGRTTRFRVQVIAWTTTILFVLFGIIGNGPSTYRYAFLFLTPVLWAAYYLRHKLHLDLAGFTLFSCALLLHDLGAFGAYQQSFFGIRFDTYVHFFFGFAVAFVLVNALHRTLELAGLQLWIFSILVLLGLSAVHELIEYASTLMLGPERGMLKINDPDKFDTQKDLLNNLVGGLLALLCRARGRQPEKHPAS